MENNRRIIEEQERIQSENEEIIDDLQYYEPDEIDIYMHI